jgi:transposase
VKAAVLDGAPGHQSAEIVAVAPPLVQLPAYSPELDPAERVFRALRPVVEGEPYASLDDKQARAEAWLCKLASDPNRVRSLTGWAWLVPQIHAALESPTPP